MSYALIDPVISAWVGKHALKLFTRYEGNNEIEFRNVYVSSPRGECCQIWIDEPSDGCVAVHAAEVESVDDEEMRKDWRTPVSDVADTLEEALAFVQSWMERSSLR